MRLPIFLDTDPGIDSAVTIAAAIFAPELDLQLMTAVAGNISVEKTIRNALQLLHFWDAEIPLAQGAAVPPVRAPRDTVPVHGESEMAGHDFVEHNHQPLGIPVSLTIRDALMRVPEPVILVVIGPLTNTALLLSQCPECKPYTRRLVIMDGSAGRDDYTPGAEFSIAADPEVAACVFRSGIETVVCNLGATNQAILTPDYLTTLLELNRTGKMLHILFNHYRSGSMQGGLYIHDLCTVAQLMRPGLFTPKPYFVAVKTQGEFTSGTAAVDIGGCLGKPANVQMTLDLDVRGFRQWVTEVLALAL